MNMVANAATLVRVSIIKDETLYVAKSPDIRGLIVTRHNMEDLLEAVPPAIEEMLNFAGHRSIVVPLHGETKESPLFVALPLTLIETRLCRVAADV